MAEQKSIRIVIPTTLYNRLKAQCSRYGDMSALIRKILEQKIKEMEEE